MALAIRDAIDMPDAIISVNHSISDIFMFKKQKFGIMKETIQDACERVEIYKLSKNAKRFIYTYDDGKQLPSLPITFHLARRTKS